MRRFAADSFEIDSSEIKEDEETLTVPAVIAHEIVQEYELAGERVQVYKPREELEKAAFTAENAWIVETHPDIGIVRNVEDIRGTMRNAKFVNNRIKGDLIFFKNRCSPLYIEDIKNGKIKSVSIGFMFDLEETSGDFQGKRYDYIQRGLFIDHVAVAQRPGRCPYPICGIGVDFFVAGDPYPNEHSCRLRDPGTLDIVGSGEHKTNDKTYRVIFGKPKGKPKAGSVEQAYRYPVKTWSGEEARKHCQEHDGHFEPATKEEGDKMSDQEAERERLHRAAEEREEKYGIKFREPPEGHLTPPEDYPEDVRLYADPVNYKYPLDTEKRCRNALARWGAFREEYSPEERRIVYERIVKRALKMGIEAKWNPELPEARALPTEIKEQLEGFESTGDMIKRVKSLIDQLQTI